MPTRSKARVTGQPIPLSVEPQAGPSVLNEIMIKTIGEPFKQIGPQWTGPITRSRARTLGGLSKVDPERNNLQLNRSRSRKSRMDAEPNPSVISISSNESTAPSDQLAPNVPPALPATFAASSSCGDASNPLDAPAPPAHSLTSLSLLPRSQRMNILETLVKVFPVTVPEDEIYNLLDAREQCSYTADLKRYLTERRNQHRDDFEKTVNIFKLERPWEPKWFTDVMTKLILTSKPRPTVYQYIFDARKRDQESALVQKWRNLSGYIKWPLIVVAVLGFLIAICFLIDLYGEDGLNVSVPLTLFVTIIINKILADMSGTLPTD